MAIKKRFPNLISPTKDDICYATQNRQDAVKELIKAGIDLLLVVGSRNSSNSIRLCEVARAQGVESHLIDNASEIQPQWLADDQERGPDGGRVGAGLSRGRRRQVFEGPRRHG